MNEEEDRLKTALYMGFLSGALVVLFVPPSWQPLVPLLVSAGWLTRRAWSLRKRNHGRESDDR